MVDSDWYGRKRQHASASLTWWNFFTSSDQNFLCASTHQSADELAQVSVQKQGYAATDLKGDFNGTAKCVDSWFLSTANTRKVNLLLLLDKWMEIFLTAMMLWCPSLRLKYLKLHCCTAVLSRLDHAEKPLLTNKCTAMRMLVCSQFCWRHRNSYYSKAGTEMVKTDGSSTAEVSDQQKTAPTVWT